MIRWAIESVVFTVVVGMALFLGAGTIRWTMAWVYIGLYLVQQAILTLILPSELLVERSAVQEGTKQWDHFLSFLSALILPLVLYLVAGLDHRYGWTLSLSFRARCASRRSGGTAWWPAGPTSTSGTLATWAVSYTTWRHRWSWARPGR